MINLLCDARGDFRRKFLQRMLELGSGEITLSCHIGYDDADYHGPSLQWRNLKEGKLGPVVKELR